MQSSGTDETLALIRDSVDAGVQLEFDYLNSRGERERRRVDPLRIESLDADWYLRAWCHLREAVRTFRLDRISNPWSPPNRSPTAPPTSSCPTRCSRDRPTTCIVTIDVAASAAPLLADYIPDGAVTVEKDGRLRTSVRVSHYHGLKRLIASMPGVATGHRAPGCPCRGARVGGRRGGRYR